ncbi:hypothetical protein BDV95DRAFT_602175 [Massariosphaeria phaeospora]|uniref:Uncharacterized protein n=1 Tax=Massariosphaeria phaeospora TaxID=100035 RepID=A0A7C8MF71_9PLEO|nr:hypothetical protein BDV95DRAFT_602175 [Massariosphaeria phaeospora]
MKGGVLMSWVAVVAVMGVGVGAGPAKRNCPDVKCYTAVNECAVTYSKYALFFFELLSGLLVIFVLPPVWILLTPASSCWNECALPSTRLPTFTQPQCPATTVTVTAPANANANATDAVTATPAITLAPVLIPTSIPANGSCVPMSICVDAKSQCGNDTVLFGDCYDICSPRVLTPPPCAFTPITLTSSATIATTTFRARKAKRPCQAPEGKLWMCAPLDW